LPPHGIPPIPPSPGWKPPFLGASPAKEASVAKLYWHAFRDRIGHPDFARSRGEDLPNHCIDYGYAVLLARVLQLCFACGLDPTYGVGHESAERSTPLAYDLMEPFRPLVDARVASWLRRPGIPPAIDKAFKQHVLAFLEAPIPYRSSPRVPFNHALERVVRSFRSAILRNNPSDYHPWMAGSSKWAGCS